MNWTLVLFVVLAWVAVMSVVAVAITIHDKNAARRHAWRVPEHTLLLVAALGGSVAMLATMKTIRHKTQHPKFMVGIPVIIALQIVAVVAVIVSSG